MRPVRPRVLPLLALVATVVITGCGGGAGGSEDPSTSPTPAAATATPEPPPPRLTLELAADGLTAPIALVFPPDDPKRTLVVDQGGTVRELTDRGLAPGPAFLDLRKQIVELRTTSDDERGLLGVAFSPAYAEDRTVYAFRTAPVEVGGSHRNVLSAYRTDTAGLRVDPGTERELWSAPQTQASHAAGQLWFDEQGRLLLFLGDGQLPETAQNPVSTQGKVLRFDPSRPEAEPEVLASGMRHPWRISFDEPTGQLLFSEPNFTAQYQEVNAFTEGANYGWGLAVPSNGCWPLGATTPDPGCLTSVDGKPLQPTVAEYGPDLGLIIAGAHIYRGSRLGALTDRLVAVDWGISNLGSAQGGRILVSGPVGQPPYRLQRAEFTGPKDGRLWFWGLGRDSAGELYVMAMGTRAPVPGQGAVYRITSAR